MKILIVVSFKNYIGFIFSGIYNILAILWNNKELPLGRVRWVMRWVMTSQPNITGRNENLKTLLTQKSDPFIGKAVKSY